MSDKWLDEARQLAALSDQEVLARALIRVLQHIDNSDNSETKLTAGEIYQLIERLLKVGQ